MMSLHVAKTNDISIHAAREGGDLRKTVTDVVAFVFQSTPPVKAATRWGSAPATEKQFQSTPPVKAATKCPPEHCIPTVISIHAAREGGDTDGFSLLYAPVISIHAAREGGDLLDAFDGNVRLISIHAAREGGDRRAARNAHRRVYFNPRRP